MACAICETRRPKRFCPGVRGDICTICCGTEREITVTCPLDCEFLLEARLHEKPREFDRAEIPNLDVRVTEEFLESNQGLLFFVAQNLGAAAMGTADVVDADVREALDALVRTYRTMQSGVYYESVPSNPLAAALYGAVQSAVARFREEEHRETGLSRTRDADVLGLLVFLQRLAFGRDNGRRKGRAFVQFLEGYYSPSPDPGAERSSPLILP